MSQNIKDIRRLHDKNGILEDGVTIIVEQGDGSTKNYFIEGGLWASRDNDDDFSVGGFKLNIEQIKKINSLLGF